MGYGLTNHLLAVGGLVFVLSFAIASRRLPLWCAASIAFVRVFISVLYFAWYFDGQWTFLDDLSYAEHGEYLVEKGITPLSVLTTEGRQQLHGLVGSSHYLFSWWNLVTMWFCGSYYYVPVLANVVFSFGSAHLLAKLLEEMGFNGRYQRTLQVIYLLHWDTIAWSSIVNLKDPIVQWMTLSLFLAVVRMVRRQSWYYALWSLGFVLAFQHMRFYVPFIIGAAAAAWLFLQWQDVRKYPLLAGGLLMGIWILPAPGQQLLESFSPFEIAYGIARFALTPQPWNIDENYTFLMLPATLHWMMILPAVAGGAMLWREAPTARFILLYAGIMIVLYALADEIQGVRQRAQLSFVFTWAQVHFLWRWMQSPAGAAARRPARTNHELPRRVPAPHAPIARSLGSPVTRPPAKRAARP